MPSEPMHFFEQLALSLAATVGQLIGSEVKANVISREASQQEVWICAQIHADDACRLAIGLSQKTGLWLARAMLSEQPGDATTLTPEDQELLAEFWKQGLGRASTDLKTVLSDQAIDYLDAKAPEWQSAISVSIILEGQSQIELEARVSMEMVRRLTACEAQVGMKEPQSSAQVAASGDNLDLLLNVPLAVTLRFGQRRMPLREILQLSSGSVVELDRQAEDAVDLLLDDRLIARGQVVVVDGCYGLRVTEVCR